MATKKDVLSLMQSKFEKKKQEVNEEYNNNRVTIKDKFNLINEEICKEFTKRIMISDKVCGLKFKLDGPPLIKTSWYNHHENETSLENDSQTIAGVHVDYKGLDIVKQYDKIKTQRDNKLNKLTQMYEEIREKIILYGVNDELLALLKKFEKLK